MIWLMIVINGRIYELGDGGLPGKFRLWDIRAERCNLHSHAEHGNEGTKYQDALFISNSNS